MKADELRNLNLDELQQRLLDTERDFFKLRTRREVERIGDRSQMAKMRRNIARVKTVIREKELQGQSELKGSQA